MGIITKVIKYGIIFGVGYCVGKGGCMKECYPVTKTKQTIEYKLKEAEKWKIQNTQVPYKEEIALSEVLKD